MTVSWFDPISQRMRRMPEDKARVEIHEPGENQVHLARRLDYEGRVWRAVVATATSTTMATPTPAEDEEICF